MHSRPERPRSELAARVLSSLVLAPLAIAATLAGEAWFGALAGVAMTVAAFEWARLTGLLPFRPATAALLVLPGATVAATLGQGAAGGLAAGLALALAATVLAPGRRWWALAGGAYFTLPIVAVLWLMGAVEDGVLLVLWLMLIVWSTDIGAYVAGRAIGGPRLAPRVSPGKTWAGLAGGVAGAALAATAFGEYMLLDNPAALAAVAAALAAVAQGGDLLKSAVKRHFGVKDFGRLIPGHGGVLDRVDGLLAAAPALAVLVALTGGLEGPPGWR